MLGRALFLGAAAGLMACAVASAARADGGTVLAPKPNFSLGYAGFVAQWPVKGDVAKEKVWNIASMIGLFGTETSGLRREGDGGVLGEDNSGITAELKFAPGGGTKTLKSIETILLAGGPKANPREIVIFVKPDGGTFGLYPDTQEGDISREKSWAAPGGGDGIASGPKFAPGDATGIAPS